MKRPITPIGIKNFGQTRRSFIKKTGAGAILPFAMGTPKVALADGPPESGVKTKYEKVRLRSKSVITGNVTAFNAIQDGIVKGNLHQDSDILNASVCFSACHFVGKTLTPSVTTEKCVIDKWYDEITVNIVALSSRKFGRAPRIGECPVITAKLVATPNNGAGIVDLVPSGTFALPSDGGDSNAGSAVAICGAWANVENEPKQKAFQLRVFTAWMQHGGGWRVKSSSSGNPVVADACLIPTGHPGGVWPHEANNKPNDWDSTPKASGPGIFAKSTLEADSMYLGAYFNCSLAMLANPAIDSEVASIPSLLDTVVAPVRVKGNSYYETISQPLTFRAGGSSGGTPLNYYSEPTDNNLQKTEMQFKFEMRTRTP